MPGRVKQRQKTVRYTELRKIESSDHVDAEEVICNLVYNDKACILWTFSNLSMTYSGRTESAVERCRARCDRILTGQLHRMATPHLSAAILWLHSLVAILWHVCGRPSKPRKSSASIVSTIHWKTSSTPGLTVSCSIEDTVLRQTIYEVAAVANVIRRESPLKMYKLYLAALS